MSNFNPPNQQSSTGALPIVAPSTTPVGGAVTTIASGGTAVTVFAAGAIQNVADIQNPATATETLYVDITGATAAAGSGTAFGLAPGQSYRISAPIATAVSAVAATPGHAFVAVRY